jgi:putative methyltransferase (TIGR04325 family)
MVAGSGVNTAMTLSHLAGRLIPPVIADLLRSLRPPPPPLAAPESIRFSGSYASWADAERDSTGYGAPAILEHVRAAALRVKNGEAAFERDGLASLEAEHRFPLLACLLRAAASGRRLGVLDFGGSLGSTYYQCRAFLRPALDLRWSVVDQPAFVACGRAEFEEDSLRFYSSVDECLHSETPDLLLLSGVVHYLREPHVFLAEAAARRFPFVLIDRTPFLDEDSDLLMVEHVPESVYLASYPAWFFARARFLSHFEHEYREVARFPALDAYALPARAVSWEGLFYQLEPQAAPSLSAGREGRTV